ncbi:MAG TPA: hypothetical protein VKR52_15075 [Terracidiphilus sp.]|nr:hypothetical protein [Terracidiphilus sp.]
MREPAEHRSGQLNEPQRRRLMVTCKYIDGLLCEIESALESARSHSPFPRYVVDVTPAQARHIESEISRLRDELLRFLAWQELAPQPPDIPVTRSVLTDLSFIDNAVEELKPRYMRGCGPVPEDALEPLNQSIRGLQAMVRDLQGYIRHEVREEPKG